MNSGSDNELRVVLGAEAARILESAIYSAQGQFEAAKRWNLLHWCLGAAAATLSTAAAVLTFAADSQVLSGVSSIVAAVIAALMTGVRPDKRAEQAQTGGNGYTALRNDARQLRDIQVPNDGIEEVRSALTALTARVADLDHASDPIPRWAYLRAKRNIEEGGQQFAGDPA